MASPFHPNNPPEDEQKQTGSEQQVKTFDTTGQSGNNSDETDRARSN